MGRIENLSPGNLWEVGRAVSFYSLLMPVDSNTARGGFFAPPTYALDLEWPPRGGDLPSTTLFREPLLNMRRTALSLAALAAVAAALLWAFTNSLRRALAGDTLHAMLLAQALAGWLLYTWFNPLEPFLWVLEFMPLWIAILADLSRGRGRVYWIALAFLLLVVGCHNWFAFYLPFR